MQPITQKGINTKFGILAHHDKMQLQEKGNNSESYSFGVMSLLSIGRFTFVHPFVQEFCLSHSSENICSRDKGDQ